jgi:3-hydroxybutyryl-CoA dehydrogenase
MSGISLTVTILGTGTMGQGIAQVAAQSGHTTRIYDSVDGKAKKAIETISAQLEKLVGKGKITGDARHQTMSRLSAATSAADAAAGADVILEAVPEDLRLKLEVLGPLLDRAA